MELKKSSAVDEYIANTPIERHGKMQEIRNLVFEMAPEVEEMISQRMPSYKLNGRQLMYFANGKNHIGFFVDTKIMEANKEKIKNYVRCNSGFQLKLDEPLPIDLMREFLALKIEQIEQLSKKK